MKRCWLVSEFQNARYWRRTAKDKHVKADTYSPQYPLEERCALEHVFWIPTNALVTFHRFLLFHTKINTYAFSFWIRSHTAYLVYICQDVSQQGLNQGPFDAIASMKHIYLPCRWYPPSICIHLLACDHDEFPRQDSAWVSVAPPPW